MHNTIKLALGSFFGLCCSQVRDYCLKAIGEEKLPGLHRLFVQAMLNAQSPWEEVSGEKIPKGKELVR